MERRFIQQQRAGVTVETRADGGKFIIGYGAVFYRAGDPGTEFVLWDDAYGKAVERIQPGAFDAALRLDDVRGLKNHDPNYLLGRTKSGTMKLSVDERGLKYAISAPDTQVARDAMTEIARGDMSGSSFAFAIRDGGQRWTYEYDKDGRETATRDLLNLELFDVSPVAFPAYEGTTTGIRSRPDAAKDEARASYEADKYAKEAERTVVGMGAAFGAAFGAAVAARARACEVG